MADKVQKSVRTTADMADFIEREAEQKDLSEADVLRQLLRDGIRYRRQMNQITNQLAAVEDRLGNLEDETARLADEAAEVDADSLLSL